MEEIDATKEPKRPVIDDIVNFEAFGMLMSMTIDQKEIFESLPRKIRKAQAKALQSKLKSGQLVKRVLNDKVIYISREAYLKALEEGDTREVDYSRSVDEIK